MFVRIFREINIKITPQRGHRPLLLGWLGQGAHVETCSMFKVVSPAFGRGYASNGSSVKDAKEEGISYQEEKTGSNRLLVSLFASELI